METDQITGMANSQYRLSETQEKNIEIFCEIAKQNGASLTINDILELASIEAEERELEEAWNRSPVLSARYKIQFKRISEIDSPAQVDDSRERFARAITTLDHAKKFALYFEKDNNVKLVSVSGSTSYRSVSKQDDLDFFCIARDGTLWKFLLKALILSRIYKIEVKDSPPLCFSYIMEESRARNLFAKESDGLFARDAIMAVVLKGEKFYRDILSNASWIGSYFPKMYQNRISDLGSKKEKTDQRGVGVLNVIINYFLSFTLGKYIQWKSMVFNKRMLRSGERKRLFRARIDGGQCIFESNDYLELRNKYTKFKNKP